MVVDYHPREASKREARIIVHHDAEDPCRVAIRGQV